MLGVQFDKDELVASMNVNRAHAKRERTTGIERNNEIGFRIKGNGLPFAERGSFGTGEGEGSAQTKLAVMSGGNVFKRDTGFVLDLDNRARRNIAVRGKDHTIAIEHFRDYIV